MAYSQIKCVGYDLLGSNGEDGLRFAWSYNNKKYLVESAAFPQKSKLEQSNNISGYTTSVSAGCVLRTLGLACRFCRTGNTVPFSGFLSAYDIAKQNVFMVLTDLYCNDHPNLKYNAREFAYMGQGEPGYSYIQVREAIRITNNVMRALNQKVYRHIIATSGIPELVTSYLDDIKNHTFDSRVTFHFSLHATENRNYIMPINSLYPYEDILKKLPEVYNITGEKPCIGILMFKNYTPKSETFAYSNDYDTMSRIADIIDSNTMRVSLCEFNAADDTGKADFWNEEESYRLKNIFEERSIESKLFSSFGKEKFAACGTLGGKQPDFKAGNKWEELEKMSEELVMQYI